jgi:hypothetical protein
MPAQPVVAGIAEERVRIRVAFDHVAEARACDHLDVLVGVAKGADVVVDGPEVDLNGGEAPGIAHGVAPGTALEGVAAVAADQQVVAVVAIKRIVAAGALEGVAAIAALETIAAVVADDQVIVLRADDAFDRGVAVTGRVARVLRHVRHVHDKPGRGGRVAGDVEVVAAVDMIGARAADENVHALAAVQGVGPAAAVEHVHAVDVVGAGEHVIAGQPVEHPPPKSASSCSVPSW